MIFLFSNFFMVFNYIKKNHNNDRKMAISLSPKVPKLLDINTSNIISK